MEQNNISFDSKIFPLGEKNYYFFSFSAVSNRVREISCNITIEDEVIEPGNIHSRKSRNIVRKIAISDFLSDDKLVDYLLYLLQGYRVYTELQGSNRPAHRQKLIEYFQNNLEFIAFRQQFGEITSALLEPRPTPHSNLTAMEKEIKKHRNHMATLAIPLAIGLVLLLLFIINILNIRIQSAEDAIWTQMESGDYYFSKLEVLYRREFSDTTPNYNITVPSYTFPPNFYNYQLPDAEIPEIEIPDMDDLVTDPIIAPEPMAYRTSGTSFSYNPNLNYPPSTLYLVRFEDKNGDMVYTTASGNRYSDLEKAYQGNGWASGCFTAYSSDTKYAASMCEAYGESGDILPLCFYQIDYDSIAQYKAQKFISNSLILIPTLLILIPTSISFFTSYFRRKELLTLLQESGY